MKLMPVEVKNHREAADEGFNGVRRRGVLARDEDGQLVVCCRRTANEKGWEIEGKFFTRSKKVAEGKPTVEKAIPSKTTKAAPKPARKAKSAKVVLASTVQDDLVKELTAKAANLL